MNLPDYHIVLAVAAFILYDNKELLIVKKSPHERVDAGLWVVPGGKIKPDEPILEGLKREVCEEVGITYENAEWLGEDVFKVENYTFHAEHSLIHLTKKPHVFLEKKMEGYRWITRAGLNDFKMPANLRKRALFVLDNYSRM